jgi:tetratricopeptide (TPR) repeat protein
MEKTEEEYYQLGKEHQQKQEWQHAINAYRKALEINPESRANVALEYIYDILNFKHNDLLNP